MESGRSKTAGAKRSAIIMPWAGSAREIAATMIFCAMNNDQLQPMSKRRKHGMTETGPRTPNSRSGPKPSCRLPIAGWVKSSDSWFGTARQWKQSLMSAVATPADGSHRPGGHHQPRLEGAQGAESAKAAGDHRADEVGDCTDGSASHQFYRGRGPFRT